MVLVAHTAAGSGNAANVTTPAIDTSGANFLIVATGLFSSFVAPADSKGNTYSFLTAYSSVLGGFVRLWYCLTPTVGPGHTFSVPGSSVNYPSICAAAFSAAGALMFDVQNGAQAVGASAPIIQPGVVNPGQVNELILTAVVTGLNADSVSSISTGFVITDLVASSNLFHLGLGMAYQIQTAATPENPTWVGTGLQAAAIATFRLASLPPPPGPPSPPPTPPPPPPAPSALPCDAVSSAPETDNRFKLEKVIATMRPTVHLPERGTVK